MQILSKFGFEFGQNKLDKEKEKQLPNQMATNNTDGALEIERMFGGMVQSGLVRSTEFKEQAELINENRKVAEYFDVDNAIDEIVNEMVSIDPEKVPVALVLDETDFSENIKERIREEFDYVLRLLRFSTQGNDIVRNWYVDGMLFNHIVIDIKRPKLGIIDLVRLDPRFIKLVREVQKRPDINGNDTIQSISEYYIYDETEKKSGTFFDARYDKTTIIAKDAISYIHSGIVDEEKGIVKSHLNKAIKPANQLQTVEHSLVIYRLSRAPERRVFYVDVGSLPKTAAATYLEKIRQKYRNKSVYDVNRGTLLSDKNHMSMLEDFWLPRREGSRGTQVDVLQGGQNLGEIDDIVYFQKRLLKALNVPQSRMEQDALVSIGNTGELTREELKFSKFIQKLRSRFNELFLQLLKVQLVLKKVITREEWEQNFTEIRFDYTQDSYIVEQMELENWRTRFDMLKDIHEYAGDYVSREFIMRKVLRMTEEDIKEMDKQIKKEKAEGYHAEEEDENGSRWG